MDSEILMFKMISISPQFPAFQTFLLLVVLTNVGAK